MKGNRDFGFDCSTVCILLEDYVKGKLEKDKRKGVKKHLGKCKSCKKIYLDLIKKS